MILSTNSREVVEVNITPKNKGGRGPSSPQLRYSRKHLEFQESPPSYEKNSIVQYILGDSESKKLRLSNENRKVNDQSFPNTKSSIDSTIPNNQRTMNQSEYENLRQTEAGKVIQ